MYLKDFRKIFNSNALDFIFKNVIVSSVYLNKSKDKMWWLSRGGEKKPVPYKELDARDPDVQRLCEKKGNKRIQRFVHRYTYPVGSKLHWQWAEDGTTDPTTAQTMTNVFQDPPAYMIVKDRGEYYKINFKKILQDLAVALFMWMAVKYFRPVDWTQEQIAQTLGDSPQTEVIQKTQANHQTTTKKQAPVQQNQPTQQPANHSSRPVEDTKVRNNETVSTEKWIQDIVTPIEEYRDPFEVKVQYYIEVLQKYIDEHTDDLIKWGNRGIANRELKALQSTEIQQQRKAINRIEDSLKDVIKLYEEDPNTLYVEVSKSWTDNPAS